MRRHLPQPAEPPAGTLHLLGIDFSWASVAERERLAFDAAQAGALLRQAAALPGLDEAAVVSTCNRTEFYVVGDRDAGDRLLALVRRERATAGPHSDRCEMRRVSGDAAVRQLFMLAAGLQSLMLGDAFIARQMKEALRVASAAGTLGPVLNRAFQQAFAVAHRARTCTDIARGDNSVGAVVAAHLAAVLPEHGRILLIGAGTTAQEVARCVAKRRAGALTIINRTAQAARDLARLCGAQVADWETLPGWLKKADAVVCATAARVPIVREEDLGAAWPVLVDLGVPRNIAVPSGWPCLTIDELVDRQSAALERRTQAVPAVEALVTDEMTRWQQWQAGRPIERLLRRLFASAAATRRRCATEMVEHGWLGTVDEAERFLAQWSGSWLKSHAAELRDWSSAEAPARDAGRGASRRRKPMCDTTDVRTR